MKKEKSAQALSDFLLLLRVLKSLQENRRLDGVEAKEARWLSEAREKEASELIRRWQDGTRLRLLIEEDKLL